MTTMTKVTEKTNKKELVEFLKEVKGTKDKSLSDRISYTLTACKKDLTQVMKSDLFDLCKEVMESLTPAQLPLENSVKKPSLGKGKLKPKEESAPEKEEKEEKEEKTTEPEENKKETKKSSVPKKKTVEPKPENKEEVKPTIATSKKTRSFAKLFPESFKHKELGNLIARKDLTSYEDIKKALDNEETLYFACYWSPKLLKEFEYSHVFNVQAPKSFENNLDMFQAICTCETIDRIWAMSIITEAMTWFDDDCFEYMQEVDPVTGDSYDIRVTVGTEFEIYAPAEETK